MINPNRRWILHVALAGGAVLCAVALGAAVVFMPEDKASSATPTPTQGPPDAVEPVELPALPADTAPTGTGSGEETTVEFENQGDEAYVISWLEEDGTLTPYSTLSPGESYAQPSYAGHYWLAAKEDGTPVAIFQAVDAPGHAVIE